MFYLTLILAVIIQFIIAEFLGRSKHIGRWWMFLLLSSTYIIGGLIAWLLSPSAKKLPTKPNSIVKYTGITVFVLGVLGLFAVIAQGNIAPHILSAPISFITLGAYLWMLGLGNIKNISPKFYFNFLKANGKINLNELFNFAKSNSHKVVYYFLKDEDIQSGPFTFEEIKAKRINENQLIWRPGIENFIKARDLEEIKSSIVYLPPVSENLEEITQDYGTEPIISPNFNDSNSDISFKSNDNSNDAGLFKIETKKLNNYEIFIISLCLFFLVFILSIAVWKNQSNKVSDEYSTTDSTSAVDIPVVMEGNINCYISDEVILNGKTVSLCGWQGIHSYDSVINSDQIISGGWRLPDSKEIVELYSNNGLLRLSYFAPVHIQNYGFFDLTKSELLKQNLQPNNFNSTNTKKYNHTGILYGNGTEYCAVLLIKEL